MWGNTVAIYCLKKKITKLNSQPAPYEKIKIDKNERKKNHTGKHCSNLQCFMEKSTVVILNQLNIKNNKIDKDNFEKNHNKKNNAGEHCSNPQCFKEKKLRS